MMKHREELGIRIENTDMQLPRDNEIVERDHDPLSQVIKLVVKNPPIHCLHMSNSGNDKIVSKLKASLSVEELAIFGRTCFGQYLNIPNCNFQGQVARCLMTLEVKQDDPNEFWVFVNGVVLRFTLFEFALITGLKCTGNEKQFDYSDAPPCRLMRRYFPGTTTHVKRGALVECFKNKKWGKNSEDGVKIAILYFIHTFIFSQLNDANVPARDFHLVEDGRYSQFPWGLLSFRALISSYSNSMDETKKLYRLNGMPYALQVWFYECCSEVEKEIAVRVSNGIPRLLNWRVVQQKPKYETLMPGMFSKYVYSNISPTISELANLDLPDPLNVVSNETTTFVAPEELENLPNPKNFILKEPTTSLLEDEFEDFSTPLPTDSLKKIIQHSGPSTASPAKKRRTGGVPEKVRESDKQSASSLASHLEPLNLTERDTVVGDDQHQPPVDVVMPNADAKEAPDDSANKQQEELLKGVLQSLKSYVTTYVDGKFLELQTLMMSHYTKIMKALKERPLPEKKDIDSQGNENVNDSPDERANTDRSHNTDNLDATHDHADDKGGDRFYGGDTTKEDTIQGHDELEVDGKFLELQNLMASHYTEIMRALKEKPLPEKKDIDSQGNENVNDSPDERATVDRPHNTDDPDATDDHSDDKQGDIFNGGDTTKGDIVQGHDESEICRRW